MTTLQPPACPCCGETVVLGSRLSHPRRGDRTIDVEVQHWECSTGCAGPDGEIPFRFEDAQLMRANDEKVKTAWLERFGEPMPSARRPGRKPEEPRDVRVSLLLSQSEVEALDRARGTMPRNEYIRRQLLKSAS